MLAYYQIINIFNGCSHTQQLDKVILWHHCFQLPKKNTNTTITVNMMSTMMAGCHKHWSDLLSVLCILPSWKEWEPLVVCWYLQNLIIGVLWKMAEVIKYTTFVIKRPKITKSTGFKQWHVDKLTWFPSAEPGQQDHGLMLHQRGPKEKCDPCHMKPVQLREERSSPLQRTAQTSTPHNRTRI